MSNETPKLSLKKIKSAPKLLLVFCGLAVVVLVALSQIVGRHPAMPYTLRVGSSRYGLEVARTEAEQERGLGDRSSMSPDKGMFFPFAGVASRCFWMKDMHFPLDIIWVDGNKKVTQIEPDVSPATYPKAYCYNGQYVIELRAGEAAKAHLQTGQMLDF